MKNISKAIEIADRVYLYDNSIENKEPRLILRTADDLKNVIKLPDTLDIEQLDLDATTWYLRVPSGGMYRRHRIW